MAPDDRSLDDFWVNESDLDAIADQIRETGRPLDLTSIVRLLIARWLASAARPKPPSRPAWTKHPSVRLWDPAGEWKKGNRTIVACWEGSHQRYQMRVRVGSIVEMVRDAVTIQLDGREKPAKYQLAKPGSAEAEQWRRTVEEEVAKALRADRPEERLDALMQTHGERVVSQALEALEHSSRFVSAAELWYLAELAAPPSEEQLVALAWKMVSLNVPQSTKALVPLLQPPLHPGLPSLFGLELAMRQHPQLFKVATEEESGWTLAGPPPGSFTPQRAAYDPETYDILCQPGQLAPPETAARLWALGLLPAVL